MQNMLVNSNPYGVFIASIDATKIKSEKELSTLPARYDALRIRMIATASSDWPGFFRQAQELGVSISFRSLLTKEQYTTSLTNLLEPIERELRTKAAEDTKNIGSLVIY